MNENPATHREPEHASAALSPGRRWLWFVALWCVGVGGAMLLALPFRLLVMAASH